MFMHESTASNLRSAFGGESMAHMRYLVWADKADRDALPNVGRLFRAVSRAEQAHATNHFLAMAKEAGGFLVPSGGMFGYGTTAENLKGALEGELGEINEMYPAYLAVAKFQQEKQAERSMTWALEAEKAHAALYERALKSVQAGRDVELGAVQICTVCGYTAEGDAPDFCPLCGAKKEKFQTFA